VFVRRYRWDRRRGQEIGRENRKQMYYSRNIYVQVEKGYDLIDIRKWWLPDTSMDIHPTKKGISLQLGMWEEFKKNHYQY
jgi:hypothetical protein